MACVASVALVNRLRPSLVHAGLAPAYLLYIKRSVSQSTAIDTAIVCADSLAQLKGMNP